MTAQFAPSTLSKLFFTTERFLPSASGLSREDRKQIEGDLEKLKGLIAELEAPK